MIYDSFASDLVSGNISPSRDTFYVLLVVGYSANSSHSRRKDVESYEVAASGYDKGGKPTLVSLSKAGSTTSLAFSDVRWDIAGSLTATGGVVYKANGGPSSDDELVTYLDFGKPVTCTDSTFTAHFTNGLGIGTK